FIGEILRHLSESGAVFREGGEWTYRGDVANEEIGRASCRERGKNSGGAGTLKKKIKGDVSIYDGKIKGRCMAEQTEEDLYEIKIVYFTGACLTERTESHHDEVNHDYFFFFKQKTAYEIGQ